MKKYLATALLLILSAGAIPAHASVEVVVGDKLNLYRGDGTLGGEFYVDVLGKGTATTAPYDFGTFCVQLSEYVEVSTGANSSTGTKHTYDVIGISTSTMPGLGSANLGSFAERYNQKLWMR